MENLDRIKSLIDGAKRGSTQTRPFYCDDDVLDMEMQKIVMRKWLLVDHVSRIPKVGQFFLYEVGQESIIIVRESEWNVNAFFNVCRHRVSLLCLEKQGEQKRLTCPYHAWSYGLDDRLQAVRDIPADFNLAEHSPQEICHSVPYRTSIARLFDLAAERVTLRRGEHRLLRRPRERS